MSDNYSLAFVRNETSLNKALQYALSTGVKDLLCFSEEVLTVQSPPSLTVTLKNIAEYKPVDLDHKVLHEIDRRYSKWLQQNAKMQHILNEEGIASVVRMSFDSIIFQFYRRVILTKKIIHVYSPAMVIMDEYWSDFFDFNALKNSHFHIINKDYQHTSLFLTVTRFAQKSYYILVTLLGGIILPVLLGKLVNNFCDKSQIDSKVLLIGADQPNKSFLPVWKKITPHFSSHGKGKYATLRIRTVRDDIKQKKFWLDGLIPLKHIVSVTVAFFRLSSSFFKAKQDFPLPARKEGVTATINFASDFSINIDFFFLRTFAKALLFTKVASSLANKAPSLQAVIFSILSPASRALSTVLQKHGIKTVTTTHGMVLEPIAYRSKDTVKLTWSVFDANLLSHYTHDKDCIGLPVNPEGFKEKSMVPTSWSVLQAYLPATGKYYVLSPRSNIDSKELEKTAIIFPATNQHGQSLRRFLDVCLSYLLSTAEIHKTRHIIIKLKKHPRTKLDEYEKILTEITPASLPIPVLVTWDLEINTALKNSVFALCAHSSIILDCIRHSVPFSVYTYDTLSNSAFLDTFPEWMQFKNKAGLKKISLNEVADFSETAKKLSDIYWDKKKKNTKQFNSFISVLQG